VAPKPGKGKGKGKGRGRRKGLSSLYDPATSLSGRPLKAAAKAATKLELQSGINAQKAALAASRRGQAYDVRALGNMGQRLDGRMGGLVSNVATYGKEANTRAAGLSADLQANLAASNQQATDRLNTLQGSVLGDQVSNLTSQDIAPGANTKALAGMMAQQQAGANQQQSSWNNLGAVLGSMNQASTAGMSDAAYYGARNERENVARNINTRIADRQQMGAEERAKTRSELATIRGLRGATTLKNLMELRREQQDYGARRAEIAATLKNQKADNAIDWYNAITNRREQNANARDDAADNRNDARENGGGGNDNRMNGQEWNQWKSALKTEIERKPGERITNWNQVLDNIGAVEGVSWTPRERRQFKRRAKKWYSKKYG
jgi:hypothetical protein